MPTVVVIARAFRGEPLKRAVVGAGGTVIYLANPEVLDLVESEELPAVGFPLEDVFVFDQSVFSALESEWRERGRTSGDLWGQLDRYQHRTHLTTKRAND